MGHLIISPPQPSLVLPLDTPRTGGQQQGGWERTSGEKEKGRENEVDQGGSHVIILELWEGDDQGEIEGER